MLASITPLGERGRRSRWWITVVAFASASTAAGAALGALLGAAGRIAVSPVLSEDGRLAVLAGLLAAAIVIDMKARRIPGPRRQVNQRWLDEYRGWVYGAGFGSQLGLGITTVVASSATYVAIAGAALTATPWQSAVVLGCYGAVRGLTPLLAARVSSPAALIEIHRALARWGAPVRSAGLIAMAASLSAAVAGALW